MKTNKDYTIQDYRGYGSITVPAGTRLTHQTASGIDLKYHFVMDLTWIIKNYPDMHPMQLLHDANYYGIDVPVEYVDYENPTTASPLTGYYTRQMERIGNPHTDYAPLVKFTHGDTHTNWMALNDESATELVKWFIAHYNVNL